jgi:hypothetical protein
VRLRCFYCGKSVSNEVPDSTIVRACLECPECIEEYSARMKEAGILDKWEEVMDLRTWRKEQP